MKILLMSMPDISSVVVHPSSIHIPNLAIESVAANIDDSNDVYIADLIRKRRNIVKYLTKIIKKINPEVIALSSMSWQYDTCLKIVKFLKSEFPEIKIALGGYHATLEYDEVADSEDAKYFDFIIRGEGEFVFRDLIRSLEGKGNLEDIKGLSYKKDGKFVHNERAELLDLNQIKLPIRDKRRITNGYHVFFEKVEALETSRGCTRGCHFCSMNEMYGRSFRKYSIDRVIADIDNIYNEKKTKLIFIADDNIVLDPKRLIELCDRIIDKKYKNLRFIVQCDSPTIAKNEKMVEKMSAAGMRIIFLGIENASSKNLSKMNKGDIVGLARKAVENCQKNNIAVLAGLIFGLPDDDEQSIVENYEFAKSLDIEAFLCQIITPYPKTIMRQDLIEANLVTNFNNYKFYDGSYANVRTKNLSSEDLHYLFWYYKQKILGWWEPSTYLKKQMPFYSFVFNVLIKPILKRKFNKILKKNGWKERYEKEMVRIHEMNNFKDLEDYCLGLENR